MKLMRTGKEYLKQINYWRDEQDKKLRAEDSWLALAGLFWFQEGVNSFGSGSANDIILPDKELPERIGHFYLSDGLVHMEIDHSTGIDVDGQTVMHASLLPDTSGEAQRITVNDLTMMVIERDGNFGLRLWDNSRAERVNFPDKQWFPVDETYRVEGMYQPYPKPFELRLERTIGSVLETHSDGTVEFELGGSTQRLIALSEDDGSLFLIFKDLTSGSTTYPGGRYLTTGPPSEGGSVIVDFNRSYQPPCAVTSYATCVLPPKENNLEIKIEAGERLK